MNDIMIRHLSKSFGDKTVLSDINLTIGQGQTTCLMGPSGSGKTTLLNLLLGFACPDSGSIEGLPQKISCVFQEDRLCEDFSPLGNLRFVSGKKKSTESLKEILAALGLKEQAETPVKKLSGGMKRRVAIARALCVDFDLLILDEPFKGLDEALKRDVMTYVREKTAGKTVLCVTHDQNEAAFLGGQILRLLPSLS